MKKSSLLISLISLIVSICFGIYVFKYYNEYINVISLTSVFYAIIICSVFEKALDKIDEYKLKCIIKDKYVITLKNLNECKETLNKYKNKKEINLRGSLLKDILKNIDDLFSMDDHLKKTYQDHRKELQKEKDIDISNIERIINIIEKIKKSAERKYNE